MFVPMTVGDVKIGFESNIDKMAYNTFRIEISAVDNSDVAMPIRRKKHLERVSGERNKNNHCMQNTLK